MSLERGPRLLERGLVAERCAFGRCLRERLLAQHRTNRRDELRTHPFVHGIRVMPIA